MVIAKWLCNRNTDDKVEGFFFRYITCGNITCGNQQKLKISPIFHAWKIDFLEAKKIEKNKKSDRFLKKYTYQNPIYVTVLNWKKKERINSIIINNRVNSTLWWKSLCTVKSQHFLINIDTCSYHKVVSHWKVIWLHADIVGMNRCRTNNDSGNSTLCLG